MSNDPKRLDLITGEHWKDIVSYNANTGILTWKVKRPGPHGNIGDEAGTIDVRRRYKTFRYKQMRFPAHRVAWEVVNGPIPHGKYIDHINRDGLDNRLVNLRIVSLSENQRNRRLNKNNTMGIPGIAQHRGGFSVTCAKQHITWTTDFFEACCARKSAEVKAGYMSV